MWFRRSELLAWFHLLASHQARSSLNGTHPINMPLKKLLKSLELRHKYFSVIQTSMSVISFIFIQMHQIISWGQSSCRIKSKTQKRYTTTEREWELLSAIEICKEYKNILSGYQSLIMIFKDHEKNTFYALKEISSYHILRWRSLLEKYGVTFDHLPGKKKLASYSRRWIIQSWYWGQEETPVALTVQMHTVLIFKKKQMSRNQD
jgi:hypothetical protein